MPRRALPDFQPVLAVFVLALGAIAVDILMPASPHCTVEGFQATRAAADGNTEPACMPSLAMTDRRFREP